MFYVRVMMVTMSSSAGRAAWYGKREMIAIREPSDGMYLVKLRGVGEKAMPTFEVGGKMLRLWYS